MADERVGDGHRISCGDEDVEIADRLAAAAKAAGRHGLADARDRAQAFEQRLQRVHRIRQQEALRFTLQPVVDRFEQMSFGFRAEARQLTHVPALRFRAKLLERIDVQCVMERLHTLRAEPGTSSSSTIAPGNA